MASREFIGGVIAFAETAAKGIGREFGAVCESRSIEWLEVVFAIGDGLESGGEGDVARVSRRAQRRFRREEFSKFKRER